jgi:hypothetical protein
MLETWENNVDSITEKVAKKVSLVKTTGILGTLT